jgi:hypothetical protein
MPITREPLKTQPVTRPKTLTRVEGKDRDLQRVQDAVQEAVGGLAANPMLAGKMLTDIALDGTDDEAVAHGLGKVPTGWQIHDRNADARVWRVSWDTREIVLRASAPVTVSIYVFG